MSKESWIIELQDEWKSTNPVREREIKQRKCIYRVPEFIREMRRSDAYEVYNPHFISLGPYHHGDEILRGMEKVKRKILGCYLSKINRTLDEAVESMGKEVCSLMDAYDGLEEPWTDKDRFAQLMVVDGCFLLGWLYFWGNLENDEQLRWCYEELASVSFTISTDLILLENQVPRRALEIMAELGVDKVPTIDVGHLLLQQEIDCPTISPTDSIHFNHKLQALWLSSRIRNDFLFKSISEREVNPPTVSELEEAGVLIEKANSMCITFEKGVLKLPPIKFVDNINRIYHNLMAFEKMHNLDPEFFSFVDFIDCLVDTEKDVEILRKSGVIQGGTASDFSVADFFNWVTRRVYPPQRKWRTTGDDVAKSLAEYCKKWQNRWYASFKHLYLKNPWAFISLLGALFLLALTVLATVYTVLSYYHS